MDNLVDNVTLNDPRVKIRVRVKKGQSRAILTDMTLTLTPLHKGSGSRVRVKVAMQGSRVNGIVVSDNVTASSLMVRRAER